MLPTYLRLNTLPARLLHIYNPLLIHVGRGVHENKEEKTLPCVTRVITQYVHINVISDLVYVQHVFKLFDIRVLRFLKAVL